MSYRQPQGSAAPGGFAQPSPPTQIGRTSPNPPVPSVAQNTIGQPGSISTASSSSTLHPSGSGGIAGQDKGPDYVYFERKPAQFTDATTGKATAAKMKLELYYKEAVEGVVGRKER
jgi:protein-serine/threonine kinase